LTNSSPSPSNATPRDAATPSAEVQAAENSKLTTPPGMNSIQ
jgi:hypothetical protein